MNCPRCNAEMSEESIYGPCKQCRIQLNQNAGLLAAWRILCYNLARKPRPEQLNSKYKEWT